MGLTRLEHVGNAYKRWWFDSATLFKGLYRAIYRNVKLNPT